MLLLFWPLWNVESERNVPTEVFGCRPNRYKASSAASRLTMSRLPAKRACSSLVNWRCCIFCGSDENHIASICDAQYCVVIDLDL